MEGDKEVVEGKYGKLKKSYGRSNLLRQEICQRAHIKMLEER